MQREEEVVYLYLDDIIPNRFQPREVFEERPLKELAVSIKEHGVIQPIIVRKVNDKYEIIAGERRYKASALAGLTKIPAIIRNLDDKETSKVALLENLQRKNLNPLEEARTYQKILEIDEMTQEELAKTMGKSQSAVANKLRLLSLSEEVQQALLKEQISERHARTLLNISNHDKQKEVLSEVINNKMTVRQLEEKIKENNQPMLSSIQEDFKLEETEMLLPEESKQLPETNNFISSDPLIPNFNGTNNNEPILKPTFMSESENTKDENPNNETQPKFINFGEINDEDETESNGDGLNLFGTAPTNTSINFNEIQENSQDISSMKAQENQIGSDLDSLLKIGDNNSSQQNLNNHNAGESFKFFSPAAEAIKESEEKSNEKGSEDYFKAPDLINVNLPGDNLLYNTNNVPLSDTFNLNLGNNNNEKTVINSINDAIDSIRSVLKKIEDNGIKVEKDEMSLENSFQIVIKLQK